MPIRAVPAEQDRRRRPVLDAERAGPFRNQSIAEQSKSPGAAQAVGLRQTRQQLEVDFLRQPAEGAVTDVVRALNNMPGFRWCATSPSTWRRTS